MFGDTQERVVFCGEYRHNACGYIEKPDYFKTKKDNWYHNWYRISFSLA